MSSCNRLRAAGQTVVFTNGVYDLLHPGHVRYLQAARAEGDALIVGVNSDRSVRALKGPHRPVHPEDERAELIAALASVDAAVVFDEDTPQEIITALQPDVLVKGADWPADQIVGRAVVEARGGRVVRVQVAPGSLEHAAHRTDAPGRLGCRSRTTRRAAERTEAVSATRLLRRAWPRWSGASYTGGFTMSTTTSLTLRALLKTAVARTGIDAPGGTVAGLSPSAQALALASLSHSNPERLVVAVVPTDADVERLTDDTRFFAGAIEGRGRDDIERLVLPFPSQEVDPYRGLAPHLRVASARAPCPLRCECGRRTHRDCVRGGVAAEGQPAAPAAQRCAQPRARGRNRAARSRRAAR